VAELKEHLARDTISEGAVFKSTTRDDSAQINGVAWMRVKRTAGLTGAANFRFHDLRHTAGTYLNEAGASAIQIAAALGHKTLAMAKRYSHQSPEFTRSVFDKLTKRMAKKPTGG
jgi:integrase